MTGLWLGVAFAAEPALVAGRTPVGEMRVKPAGVRLVRESVELKILSIDEVEVRATYQLENPSDEDAVVNFRVPVTSGGPDGETRDSNAAASIRLMANGNFVPCIVRPGDPMKTPYEAVGGTVDRWCSADLVVKPGAQEVRMSYEGLLLFQRTRAGRDLLPGGADRKLVYGLTDVKTWEGEPEEVVVTVDLGAQADAATVVEPAGSQRKGSQVTWRLAKKDLAAAPWIEVDLKTAQADRRALLFGASSADDPFRVASITVSAGDPAALTDGDPGTAWCVKGFGEVDLTWSAAPEGGRDLPGKTCRAGLVHVPGDASSEARWADTGPTQLTLSPCGWKSPKQPVPVIRADSAASAGQITRIDDALSARFFDDWRGRDQSAKPACIRIRFDEPREVCLSEVAWNVICE